MGDPNDTPAAAGTVTDTTPVDALAGILDDPIESDTEESEGHAEGDAEGEGAEGLADALAKSEEDSGENAEANQNEPSDGRFVEHNARVKLPDGTTTTVSELSKGYLRQSDYTRKTQEAAQLRQAVESERQWVGQATQQLQTQLGQVKAMMDHWQPRPPEVPYAEDPLAWGEYEHQTRAWNEWQNAINTEAQHIYGRQVEEIVGAYQNRMAWENQELVQKFPAMSDPNKRQTFLTETARVFGEKYGFSPEEIAGIGDHRFILVIRDLMRADRLSARAPEVKDKIKDKPKFIRGGRRGGDPSRDAKRSRIDRLRETGSRADGVRSLMDLDL